MWYDEDTPKKVDYKRIKLKLLRTETHNQFDKLWKHNKGNKSQARDNAYLWLAKAMCVSKREAHISHFSEEQCNKLIKLLKGSIGFINRPLI